MDHRAIEATYNPLPRSIFFNLPIFNFFLFLGLLKFYFTDQLQLEYTMARKKSAAKKAREAALAESGELSTGPAAVKTSEVKSSFSKRK